jgi:hypothetical protein
MDTVLFDNWSAKYCSIEHKTKGGNFIGDTYKYDFILGTQIGTYTHVLRCLFPPEQVSEVIINCLCFKKTKSPDFILERFPVPLSDAQMQNWQTQTILWMDAIDRDFLALSQMTGDEQCMTCFRQNPGACTNWNRICSYHDLCTTWLNPVEHVEQIPLDMQIDFWNPLEEDLREVINFE